MCGIAGFVEHPSRHDAEQLRAMAGRMAQTLERRGPDALGIWVDAGAGVALGHRRLSVLDRSERAAQPMRSRCRRWTVVYNGEVYDHPALRRELEALGHAFRGHGDSEVLVEAISRWGPEGAARRCNGMFAFAAWDARERELTLVRDRLGEKPLYYGASRSGLVFGSQLAALRAHPGFQPRIDRDALAFFVGHSYVPAPRSIHTDARKLPAGTLLRFRPGDDPLARTPRPWWSLRRVAEEAALRAPLDPADAEASLDAQLRESVERRMRADVPVGAFLSGGIDSSLVVALMQQLAGDVPVRTFSLGYAEAEHDETPWAEGIARHLGTRHRTVIATPGAALEAIPRLAAVFDEPFADTSQIPTLLVCELARREVTVALSGDGGDELFAGYDRYFRCLDRWRRLARWPAVARRSVARSLETLAPLACDRLAHALAASGPTDLFVRANARTPRVARIVPGAGGAPDLLHAPQSWAQHPDPLREMMWLDLAGTLPESILVKVDRASMGVGLEVRTPLLDPRVVALALGLPRELLVAGGERKWLLRRVLERYVPRALFDRPKRGFGVPLGSWLRGPLREWAEALLEPRRVREAGHLEPAWVRAVWRQHLSGRRDRHLLLWNLLVFQAWLDRWGTQARPEPA